MNIEQIEELQIFGNAHSDMPIFNACHEFIMDEANEMEERIRAIRKIDDTMGLNGVCNEDSVNEYVANA
jgi:hypothetical protein